MKAKSKISFAFIICFLLSFKENVFTWAWMSALVCPSGRADAHVNVGQAIGKCSKSLELWASAWGAFMRPTISSWDTNRLSNLLFDLLLREKRLQAIKEKPSLASSSFCWPFLFLFPFGQQEDDSSQWWESRERSRSSFFFSSFSCKRTIRWKKKWWRGSPWIHSLDRPSLFFLFLIKNVIFNKRKKMNGILSREYCPGLDPRKKRIRSFAWSFSC